MSTSPQTYSWLARQFHWIMAAIIILMFFLGHTMTVLPLSELKLDLYAWHKWAGITILCLAIARLIWRYKTPRPTDQNPAVPSIMHKAATYGHWAIYGLLLITPLMGWLHSSARGFQVVLFEIIPLPNLVDKNKQLAELFEEFHEIAAWGLLILVISHIAAVIIHHFRYGDKIIRKMPPSTLHIILVIIALWTGCALMLFYRVINPMVIGTPDKQLEQSQNEKAGEIKTKVISNRGWIIGEGSTLSFTAIQNNAETTGSFKSYGLKSLTFDPKNLEAAKVTVAVDIASLDLGNDLVEQTLLLPEWFNIKEFPIALFKSDNFKSEGADKYLLTGTLTINGQSHPQKIHLTIIESQENQKTTLHVAGKAALSRTAFSIGKGEWADTDTLKDEITLEIKVDATKQQ